MKGLIRRAYEAGVRDGVKQSLRSLGLDYIDIMLMAVAEAKYKEPVVQDHLPVLEQLKQEGLIRFIGSSEQTRSDGAHEWLRAILPTGAVDVAVVGHNMINQSAERTVFPYCQKHDIGVLNIFTVRNLFWNPLRLREVTAELRAAGKVPSDGLPDDDPLGWLIDDDVGSLVEAAYRYALHTDAVTAVMCGTIESAELEENLSIFEKGPLSVPLVDKLHAIFGDINDPIGN